MSVVALVAVVAAVIGTVTTVALQDSMYQQLNNQLTDITKRAQGMPQNNRGDGLPRSPGSQGGKVNGPAPLDFVIGGGQSAGTIGALLQDGTVSKAIISQNSTSDHQIEPKDLNDAQKSAIATVPRDGKPHSVDVPGGLGSYRFESFITDSGNTIVVGIPESNALATLHNLIIVEISVTVAGLAAAGVAGTFLIGVALRPLRRVASTATRVSEIPLHSGEVALFERVPDAEADPRTEVGQVGAALNRMLGHVGSALAVRQESEMRVRQFVADASHELRTPLASIRGYAELTRRGREETGPDTRHALGRIESEASRMTGLVEDLLLLARLDAGRPLSYESTDLSPLVVDALSDARAAGQDHKWRLELPDDPANVLGDGPRLHQVLVNLLANARTHTPPGTTVTARVQHTGPWVLMEIQDDGPGIPADLLPHVFERFARGDASRSRNAGSTGLGLAIVQAVVTAHGGGVTVQSVPGRTVFGVHLPVQLPVQRSGDAPATHRHGTG
ncbi:sensor histidine kinase [Streptomyces beijiangensis]|uniref:histidine kinase n=1 Tax=Streptomyces beijiangensis TaxID=163361 RepID=A0A939JMF8_9ACTN|nr:HAMP domain-containing sensor histidine kinase [Streptomyces beijiangensis]MBO0517400.1 HAMP domain-containing histidine kinase [Streptomyces beijiangensis]